MDKVEKLAKKVAAKKEATEMTVLSKEENSHMIALLMEAERKSSAVIEKAKKRKAATLKKARDESAVELEKYRKHLEAEFIRLQNNFANSKGEDEDRVDKDLKTKKAELDKAFKLHSTSTLDHVVEIVINVNAEVHKNFRND